MLLYYKVKASYQITEHRMQGDMAKSDIKINIFMSVNQSVDYQHKFHIIISVKFKDRFLGCGFTLFVVLDYFTILQICGSLLYLLTVLHNV